MYKRQVDELIVSQTGISTRLKSGRYIIEVDGSDTRFTITGNQVVLSRGETWVVRIEEKRTSKRPTGSHGLAATSNNGSHDNGPEGTFRKEIGHSAYLTWESPNKVRLNDWFAATLNLNATQRKSINDLLATTWKQYIEAEREYTEFSRTADGHLYAVVREFTEKQSALDAEFWQQLVKLVDGRTEELIHGISTQRGDGHGDDGWPTPQGRHRTYPSVLGWHHSRLPVTIELWKRGSRFHFKFNGAEYGTSGNTKSLPPEFEHYWRIGSEELAKGSANGPSQKQKNVLNHKQVSSTLNANTRTVDLGGDANESGVIEGMLQGFPDDHRDIKYSITLSAVQKKSEGSPQDRIRELGPRKPGIVVSAGERFEFTGIPNGKWRLHAVAMIQSRRLIVGKPVQFELEVKPHHTTQIGIAFNSEDNTAGWVDSVAVDKNRDK